MDIRNRKELCRFAGERLENAPQNKKIALIYASVSVGLSLLCAVADYVLSLQIDQTGGLSNMGTRSVLAALQTMLPLVQTAIVMCIQLGYGAAMLRIARGQYVSTQTLRLGFDRFWVLLRYTVLRTLYFTALAIASAYMGVMIFLISPFSKTVMELLMPLVAGGTVVDASTIPESVYGPVMDALTPAFVLCAVIYCLVAIPMMYRLRMSNYVIIDKPGFGAMRAMGESRKMMKGNCLKLFRLDLHLWWFYAATTAASVICYGDQLLPMIGITLPFSPEVNFFLFYGIYWVLQFGIFCLLLNKVEVPYALAYDAIRPQEAPADGVVLGNIFQM